MEPAGILRSSDGCPLSHNLSRRIKHYFQSDDYLYAARIIYKQLGKHLSRKNDANRVFVFCSSSKHTARRRWCKYAMSTISACLRASHIVIDDPFRRLFVRQCRIVRNNYVNHCYCRVYTDHLWCSIWNAVDAMQ